MHKTVGQLLEDTNEFFHWLNSASISLVVFKAVIESGIVDRLVAAPATLAELAAVSGIPADKVGRLVNVLAAHELVELAAGGHVVGKPSLTVLKAVTPAIDMAAFGTLSAGLELCSALREGITPFEKRFGKPVFAYFADDPAMAATFVEFMTFQTRRAQDFIFTRHPLPPFATAVDVGGSQGVLLSEVLAHHPGARGVLFDLPEVVERISGKLAELPNGDRIAAVGGSFFEAVPAADLYLLKQILHDWTDPECVRILQAIRSAIMPGGRIVVIDCLLGDTPETNEALFIDIAMMIWSTGRERKLSEFERLFDASGFRLERVSENPRGQSVIEAVPV